ncbi:MAG: hypothetical protein M3P33_00500 [bacterium]|nr:hypothetical protein [bacterium]
MSKFWFAGGYYIDLDEYGQLRIAGPGNHLFCGFTLPKPFNISKIRQTKNRLKLQIKFSATELILHQPIMGDIRSVRSVTETANTPRPTFAQMQNLYPGQFMPTETVSKETSTPKIIFIRKFSEYKYGFELSTTKSAKIIKSDNLYHIVSSSEVVINISCFFDFPSEKIQFRHLMLNGLIKNSFTLMPSEIQNLVERSEEELGHLLSYAKTSSYEYGTVFPRDWMESAELGIGDLSKSTIEEMYAQALKNVTSDGLGWHEDVIGELAEKFKQKGEDIIDRRMVDIEPRYMLGLSRLSPQFLKKNNNISKLRSAARYVVGQAQSCNLINFKDPLVGNWRDSPGAFKNVKGKIAPFDVNAVFYPAALAQILQHHSILHIEPEIVLPLIKKWQQISQSYKFIDQSGESGFALCIYGDKQKILSVHHTDEAYLMLYGWPSREDVASFARRTLNTEYFYTESGPIIVGKHQGYSTSMYHGEVIWPKQSALVVAGLKRQLDRAFYEEWPFEMIILLRTATTQTAKNSIKAFIELDSIPELYYDNSGHPKRYDTQTIRDGQVSYIQLWSTIGFRRILRDLIYVNLKYDLPMEFY